MFDMKHFLRHFTLKPAAQEKENAPAEDCLFRVSYGTDTGLYREHNEDSFFIDNKCIHTFGESEQDCYGEKAPGMHIFGIFDGMGGEEHGEAAAEITAKTLAGAYEQLTAADPEALPELMNKVCRDADEAVCAMIAERGALAGGATFTAACTDGETVRCFWLGDSRIYLLADGKLEQLTSDHTVAAAKIAAGIYTAEESAGSRDHHALTHFIGMRRAENCTAGVCEPRELPPGGALLLCSDGLTDMLTDSEIKDILSAAPADPAQELIMGALRHGGVDNVTCIVITKPGKP